MPARVEVIETALAEPDAVIATAVQPWAHQVQPTISGEKVAQAIIAGTGADTSRFSIPDQKLFPLQLGPHSDVADRLHALGGRGGPWSPRTRSGGHGDLPFVVLPTDRRSGLLLPAWRCGVSSAVTQR